MTWRLAKSLKKLQGQINEMAPGRSRASDGSIGDAAHSARKSDHNPNEQGIVAAIDVTHDPSGGCDGRILSRSLIADSRVKYVIFNSQIWKARTGQWELYDGDNPHDHHVHVSIKPDALDQTQDWAVRIAGAPGEVPPATPTLTETRPLLKTGASGEAVRALQQLLNSLGFPCGVDGGFGPNTRSAVERFQEAHGLRVDGKVGPDTWRALGEYVQV
jgi:Putative peptidoglycan binding domain